MQGLWFLPSLIFGAFTGFSTGNWQMLLFAGTSVLTWPLSSWLQRVRYFNLEGQVRVDDGEVWIGEHRLPRREIFWRRQWHQFVWDGLAVEAEGLALPDLLATASARGFIGFQPEALWLGAADGQNFEFNLTRDGPHIFIVGATGTGKSELLRLMVTGWLSTSQDLELTLIDFKGGATMAKFANHPRVIGLATDLALTDVLAIAETLERQLLARQQRLAEAAASNIEAFQAAGGRLKRHIIVIDEMGELLRQHPKLAQVLDQIAARGRSLGMHLVVANQSLAGVSRTLLVNLRARLAIGDMDPIDLNQLGFKTRATAQRLAANWRSAKLRTGEGFELSFAFPVGF
jgi:S-DNA-T family DNA segregation ATPase FtsK/SpoIIIE